MLLEQLNCCGFNEIHNLCFYTTAKAAMTAFCKEIAENDGCAFSTSYRLRLGAFYLFTALLELSGNPITHRYGEEFAKFIKDNRLGVVRETVKRLNRKNASTHLIQGWVWTPSQKNLQEWWDKRKQESDYVP